MKAKRKSKKPVTSIKPRHPRTRWVALDFDNNIIAEGMKGETVIKKAEKITDKYIMAWVEREGEIFIF
jgi:hypothetical protein